MKFCPECGSVIEGKEMCECGYVVATGEVDKKVREALISSHPSPFSIPDVPGIPMGNVMTDEVPKDLPPIYFVRDQSGEVVKDAIYDTVRYWIGKGLSQRGIEEQLVELYQNNNMEKDEFILFLQSVLALGIEKQIKNAIEQIKNS